MRRVGWFGVTMGLAAGVAGVWTACKSPVAAGGVLLTGGWGSPQSRLTSDARFKGAVSERKITLRVKLADSTEAVAPMTLDLGQEPALVTCH